MALACEDDKSAIVTAEGKGSCSCQWEKEHHQLRNNSLLGLPDKACVTFHVFVLSQSPMRDLLRVPLLTSDLWITAASNNANLCSESKIHVKNYALF